MTKEDVKMRIEAEFDNIVAAMEDGLLSWDAVSNALDELRDTIPAMIDDIEE